MKQTTPSLGQHRATINHGHNRWDEARREWVAEYQTWCPSCRAAKATK